MASRTPRGGYLLVSLLVALELIAAAAINVATSKLPESISWASEPHILVPAIAIVITITICVQVVIHRQSKAIGHNNSDTPPLPIVSGEIPQRAKSHINRQWKYPINFSANESNNIICIFGQPGVGKSQIAASFAQECVRKNWDIVAWINGNSYSAFVGSYAQLAIFAKVAKETDDPNVACRLLRDYFQSSKYKTLLVIDDLVDANITKEMLPTQGSVKILVTTTKESIAEMGHGIRIAPLSLEESVDYLISRTGQNDRTGATAVAVELGFLPLALEQAAMYIKSRKIRFDEYARRLQQLPIKSSLPQTLENTQNIGTVAAVLLNASRIEHWALTGKPSDTNAAEQVMYLIASFSPVALDAEFLSYAHVGESHAMRDAIASISDTGLISWSTHSDKVLMHGLTARILAEEKFENFADGLRLGIDTMYRYFEQKPVDKLSLPEAQFYLEATMALSHSKEKVHQETAANQLLELRINSVDILYRMGNYKLMHEVAKELAHLASEIPIPSPTHALALSRWAHSLLAAGKSAEAVEIYRQSLQLARTTPSCSYEFTADVVIALSNALRSAGWWDEAIELLEDVIPGLEQHLGDLHAVSVNARGSLGFAYVYAGDGLKAIPILKRTYEDRLQALGPGHLMTLITLNNLGRAYLVSNQLLDALTILRRVYKHRLKMEGKDSPHTLVTEYLLGCTYSALGKKRKARRILRDALARRTNALGPEHPDTLAVARELDSIR